MRRMKCTCVLAALAAVTVLGVASPALAGNAEWKKFSECPLANPLVKENGCIFAKSGGESLFTAGNAQCRS